MQKAALIFSFLTLFLSANQCKKAGEWEKVFDKLWVRSSEEEKGDGIEVYRTEAYKFPISRGPREAFRMGKDGSFMLRIAPADAPVEIKGTWKANGKKQANVNLEKNSFIGKTDYLYQLIEVQDDMLKIKRQ
ncbi:MAG: hypothetical protein RMJ97_05440 [Raineya sp.]|nr:hypothetical protein [Raineya sp.]MDW8296313.1 hypothetical protein [Raineya sp.]